MRGSRKGRFTIRSAGFFFILSGIFEIFSLRTEVPLLGGLQGGFPAAGYHLLYFILFLAIGVGLWGGRAWGKKALFLGTTVYTLDKVQYLLAPQAMKMEIMKALQGHEEFLELIDVGLIVRITVLMTLVFVACWWGFAVYIYMRRDYFQPSGKERGEER